eukprot:TRINITY_DN30_c0_g1_i3.p1 TRINITY_DN30_c0_g1~~TRINITY_DN30_c0_g1_i3.p1  ORF type:complete len:840 (-),score=167.69 TRINITY_DN30_c0_g1_i3:303-2822(-)
MIRRPPRSTLSSSSAASDVYKRQVSTQSTGVSGATMGCFCSSEEEDKEKAREEFETTSGGFILNKTRCITDPIMLLVFIAFLVGMCYVAGLAWTDGDYYRILYGTNWKGDACGRGANSGGFVNQYWPNVLFYKELGSVCLDSCPDSTPSSQTTAIVAGDSSFAFTDTYSYQVVCTCNVQIAEGNPNCGTSSSSTACTGQTTVADSVTSALAWNTATQMGSKCSAAGDKGYFLETLTYTSATTDGDTAANFWTKFVPTFTYDQCYTSSKAGTSCGSGTFVNTLNSAEYKMNVPMCNVQYRTKEIFNRCIPWLSYSSMVSLFCSDSGDCPTDSLSEEFNSIGAFFEEAFADIGKAWYVILASVGISIVIGFLYLYFMQKCAKCVIGSGLFLVLCGLAFVTFAFYKEYNKLDDRVNTEPELATIDEDKRNRTICAVFGIIFALTLGIMMCVVICFTKQIRVAGALLQCAAEAIIDMPLLVIYPLWEVLFFMLICVAFIFGTLLLASSGDDNLDQIYGYHSFEYSASTQRTFVFWLFGFLWIAEFCASVGFMVVAFCFALWFFAPMRKPTEDEPNPGKNDREMISSPIWTSLKLTVVHHLGTVAFGSLIIAIIQMIRITLEYIETKRRELTGGGEDPSGLWKFLFCCCRCCLWCLEKCMKALNKIAYVCTVINGSGFCSSACHAMGLLISNISWFAIVSGISGCMLLFGKWACAFITAGICGWWCTYLDLSSILFPTLCCLMVAYVVASLFAEVYEMGVDTMLVCFLEIQAVECDGDKISAPPALHDEIIMVQAEAHIKVAQREAVAKAVADFKAEQKAGKSVGAVGTAKPDEESLQPGDAQM